MDTYHTTSALSNPVGDDRISDGVFEYLQTRNRMRVFTVVHSEFAKSGITKTALAKRMGKGADRVCHLLGAPGNWTLDTASDVLFAISGAVLEYQLTYPLAEPPRNLNRPEWLQAGTGSLATTGPFVTSAWNSVEGQPSPVNFGTTGAVSGFAVNYSSSDQDSRNVEAA
jgi:hypothetical protein